MAAGTNGLEAVNLAGSSVGEDLVVSVFEVHDTEASGVGLHGASRRRTPVDDGNGFTTGRGTGTVSRRERAREPTGTRRKREHDEKTTRRGTRDGKQGTRCREQATPGTRRGTDTMEIAIGEPPGTGFPTGNTPGNIGEHRHGHRERKRAPGPCGNFVKQVAGVGDGGSTRARDNTACRGSTGTAAGTGIDSSAARGGEIDGAGPAAGAGPRREGRVAGGARD